MTEAMTYRDHLARSLCQEYPDYGCSAAFDEEEPCWKHQYWYYDLADFFFRWREDPSAIMPIRENVRPEEE